MRSFSLVEGVIFVVALFWLRDQAPQNPAGAFKGRRFHTKAARPAIGWLIALMVLRCDLLTATASAQPSTAA
jgi:hypothetical protein